MLLLGIASLVTEPVNADTFKLAHGGTVEGIWLDCDQEPVRQYQIQLASGGRIVLAKTAVQEVIRSPEIERQYQLKAAECRDNVADHWAIARWCNEHDMQERRRYHLRRILRIDANHAEARRALGYSFIRGRWITRAAFMREQGYEKYKGRWKLPQEIELLESKRARDVAARQWLRQLTHWRGELGTERGSDFFKAIADVRDPLAVPALIVLSRRERVWPVRQLYISTLAKIGTPQALMGLLEIVLYDADKEAAFASLDLLAEADSTAIRDKLLEKLRDKNNAIVNRAAVALRQLGGDEAIEPLIDALVTHHVTLIPNPDTGDVDVVHFDAQNRDVLSTLLALTRSTGGFGYDEAAWKQWRFMQVKRDHAVKAGAASVRRDRR